MTRPPLQLPDDLVLRAPTAADAEAMARLDEAGLPAVLLRDDPALAPLRAIQARARAASFAAAWPGARTRLAEIGGRPAARLVDDVSDAGLHVVEIVVDPAFRRRGIAAALLARVQAEAGALALPATARIYRDNAPSLALFAGAGFALDRPPDEPQVRARWSANGVIDTR